MKAILLYLLAFPVFCIAQKKSPHGYFSVAASLHFKSHTDPGFGGVFSGNLEITNGIYAGAQVGALYLPNTDGVYVPLQAKFTIAPSLYSKKVSPLMLIEPGFGIHSHTYNFPYGGSFTEEGGFTFFAGGGLILPGASRTSGFIAVGYSSFGFKTGNEKSNLEMLGVRVGVMFR